MAVDGVVSETLSEFPDTGINTGNFALFCLHFPFSLEFPYRNLSIRNRPLIFPKIIREKQGIVYKLFPEDIEKPAVNLLSFCVEIVHLSVPMWLLKFLGNLGTEAKPD